MNVKELIFSVKFKEVKDVLEFIYYLAAGPVLAFIAYKGLAQIRVAKENSNKSAKREAYKLAAEQCSVFADKILKYSNEFDNEIKESKFLEGFDVSINSEHISVRKKVDVRFDEKDITIINNSNVLQKLINSLEGYAVYFVTGVAEPDVGYFTTGKSYVEIVKRLLPILAPYIEDGHLKHMMSLFKNWNSRLEQEALGSKLEELTAEMTKYDNNIDFRAMGVD